MGVFQIGFLLLNLTVPYFIWSNSTKKVPSTNSAVWEKSMARIVASDGGFPDCSVLQLVDIFRDLCDNSRAKFSENTTVVMERASKEVVFACEAGKDFIRASWRLEDSERADLKCRDPSGDIIPHAPAFLFDLDGRLRAIEFSATSGKRESIRMRSCPLRRRRRQRSFHAGRSRRRRCRRPQNPSRVFCAFRTDSAVPTAPDVSADPTSSVIDKSCGTSHRACYLYLDVAYRLC